MEGSFFHSETVQPFAQYGLTGPLFDFDGHTLIYTWITLGILLLVALLGRWAIKNPTSLVGYATLSILKSFKSLIEQSASTFQARYYYFVTTLFCFIFVCSALVVIPGLEEPTKNLNTTFALAIIAFLYVQREMFRAHGLSGYIQEYFKMPFALPALSPFSIKKLILCIVMGIGNILAGILSFPLEVLSKLSNVLSLSLRLFGNIFGSSIMITMFKQATTGTRLVGYIASLMQFNLIAGIIAAPILFIFVSIISLVLSCGFGLIESLIQAFVFSILTLTYITLATQHHEESEPAHTHKG